MHRRRSFFALFNQYSECPKCGTRELSRLQTKDLIDTVAANPLRRLLKLFGAPLYHCTFCRYQFRDWRERDPNARR
jgi:DNA-directed RNA polymerase subunit RPC12/RpoP